MDFFIFNQLLPPDRLCRIFFEGGEYGGMITVQYSTVYSIVELFPLTMLAISDKVFDHHFLKFIPKFSLGDDDMATGNLRRM